jgi:hypothetical protein
LGQCTLTGQQSAPQQPHLLQQVLALPQLLQGSGMQQQQRELGPVQATQPHKAWLQAAAAAAVVVFTSVTLPA